MPFIRPFIPYIAYAYVTLVGWTTRLRWLGMEHLHGARRAQGRVIYAFWHQRQVFFTWTHRGTGFAVLVSRSADGELIARTMELSGMRACRGSSSRGGAAGAREMMEAIGEGRSVGVSPDGPKGPARKVKHGILFLALKTGLPIVPIANALSLKLEFKGSWDRFQVPLPFGKAVVAHGPEVRVGASDDLALKARELEDAMNLVTSRADDEASS